MLLLIITFYCLYFFFALLVGLNRANDSYWYLTDLGLKRPGSRFSMNMAAVAWAAQSCITNTLHFLKFCLDGIMIIMILLYVGYTTSYQQWFMVHNTSRYSVMVFTTLRAIFYLCTILNSPFALLALLKMLVATLAAQAKERQFTYALGFLPNWAELILSVQRKKELVRMNHLEAEARQGKILELIRARVEKLERGEEPSTTFEQELVAAGLAEPMEEPLKEEAKTPDPGQDAATPQDPPTNPPA